MIQVGNKNTGFSLLEVIVVVFLIALFAAVGILKIDLGINRQLESEAKLLKRKFELVLDESIFSGRTHRVVFDRFNKSYYFQYYQQEKWQGLTQAPFSRKQNSVDGKFVFDLNVFAGGDSDRADAILFYSDGSMSEFELKMGIRDDRSASLDLLKQHWSIRNTIDSGLRLIAENGTQ